MPNGLVVVHERRETNIRNTKQRACGKCFKQQTDYAMQLQNTSKVNGHPKKHMNTNRPTSSHTTAKWIPKTSTRHQNQTPTRPIKRSMTQDSVGSRRLNWNTLKIHWSKISRRGRSPPWMYRLGGKCRPLNMQQPSTTAKDGIQP